MCLGVYKLGENIATGGFSSVHLATKASTKETFVLKMIKMNEINEIDELQIESKQLIPLNHANIVKYQDDFIHFDTVRVEQRYSYILIMEYCDGGDLTDKIREAQTLNKPFSERQLMEWFCQLCLAVKYLHARDIIHRDIKSPNLFLSKNSILKLGDFGLSTRGKNMKEKSCYSRVGTDCYMAPEVRDGRHYDSATNPSLKPSDVWCIGLILFELVTLIPIWDLKFDITIKVMTNPDEVWNLVNDISCYDPQINSLIKKCLNVEPDKRPTVDQILRKKFMRRHLRYLQNNKGRFIKQQVIPWIEISGSFDSTSNLSNENSFEEEPSIYSNQVEDQGDEDRSISAVRPRRNSKCSNLDEWNELVYKKKRKNRKNKKVRY